MQRFEEYEIEPELSGCNDFKFTRSGEQVEAFEVDDEICPDDSVSMAMFRTAPPPLPPPPRVREPPPRPATAAPPRRLAHAAAQAQHHPDQPQPRAPPRLKVPPAPEPRALAPQRSTAPVPPRQPPMRAPPQYGRPAPQTSSDEMTLMALSIPVSAYANPAAARQPLKLAGVRETS